MFDADVERRKAMGVDETKNIIAKVPALQASLFLLPE